MHDGIIAGNPFYDGTGSEGVGITEEDMARGGLAGDAQATAPPKDGGTPRPRLIGVEVLRLAAIFGIAVFHTFQPWFGALVGMEAGVDAAAASWGSNAIPLAILGCIDQLGAWGNHVFIMISGFFLLPKAIAASTEAGYWQGQAKACAKRASRIVVAIVFWAIVALACLLVAPDATTATTSGASWLLGGIQFIWVYLFLVIVCPLIAWVWRRLPHPGAVLLVALVATYALNAYVAFVSPGAAERGLLEWRKLLSALTYGVSFVVGGWLGQRVRPGAPNRGGILLAVIVVAMVVAELGAAALGSTAVLDALSFKSTSLVSFAGAVGALLVAVGSPQGLGTDSLPARLVVGAAGSTLGFYISQSFFSLGWHELANDLLAHAAASGFVAFVACGVAFSAVLLVVLLIVDAYVRRPLTSRLPRPTSRV